MKTKIDNTTVNLLREYLNALMDYMNSIELPNSAIRYDYDNAVAALYNLYESVRAYVKINKNEK